MLTTEAILKVFNGNQLSDGKNLKTINDKSLP
jgi:hypothetical protein